MHLSLKFSIITYLINNRLKYLYHIFYNKNQVINTMSKKYLISTDDGSSTLFLEEYGQAMHSTSGAYQESLLKHIIPSRILECNNMEKISVLDIGFGLGYNVLALINELIAKKPNTRVEIISLEKDKSFSDSMNSIKFYDLRDDIYNFIKTVYNTGEGYYNGIFIKIIFGDARKSLKTLDENTFNAVFQDPFSPSKNPELWSVEYFTLIKKLMHSEGILTTYSSADHIRRAMIEAGFKIGRGPSVGKKRDGTIASPGKIYNELDEPEIENIINNLRSVPYTDPGLNLTRETILNNRIDLIQKLKKSLK